MTRLLTLLLVSTIACSDDEAPPSDDDGSPSSECTDEKQSLQDLIEQHRACETDDDCQHLASFCLFEGRVDCTGAFYVNRDVTQEEFEQRDDAHTECVQEHSAEPDNECGTCLMGSKLPTCDQGVCAASDRFEDE